MVALQLLHAVFLNGTPGCPSHRILHWGKALCNELRTIMVEGLISIFISKNQVNFENYSIVLYYGSLFSTTFVTAIINALWTFVFNCLLP